MNMMEIVHVFQQKPLPIPPAQRRRIRRIPVQNPFGTFNPADLMMNMLSDEQKEMFQMYQDRLPTLPFFEATIGKLQPDPT